MTPNRFKHVLLFAATVTTFAFCGFGLWMQVRAEPAHGEPGASQQTDRIIAADIQHDLDQVTPRIRQLEDAQSTSGVQVVDDSAIQNKLSAVDIDLAARDYKSARQDIDSLNNSVSDWQKQLDTTLAAQAATQAQATAPNQGSSITAPIVIYHYTPNDFEKQLQFLQKHGYTTVDLDQLAGALTSHAPLPAKPIVLTFDDGFSNQLQAFQLLKKYNMKATFYIINGGDRSKWCIGASRRYDQGYPCGDGYLNWSEIRMLDQSGLITIGSHTVDHLNLASQSAEVQHFEIIQGKQDLEAQLGHPVRHFAYPYGAYNSTTLAIVREAGFTTAVTTLPGSVQVPGGIYTLHRVRNVFTLP